jgi:hypothetical protein
MDHGQHFMARCNWLWRDPTRWHIVGGLMLEAFGPVGAALAAIGLVWLIARRWRIALVTFIAGAGYFAYGLIYNVPDVSVFIISAHILMAVWIGVGSSSVLRLSSQIARRVSESAQQWTTASALIVFALLPPPGVDERPASGSCQVGWELYRWGRYVMDLRCRPARRSRDRKKSRRCIN